MENVSGENLSWFFSKWFYGTSNIDLGIDGVRQYEGNYIISVSNAGDIPMPVKMEITYDAISDVNDDREEILPSGSQISQQPIISVSKIGYLFFDGLVKKDDFLLHEKSKSVLLF